MKNPKPTAFTLIELLIVVLIVGILTAIALPQYQKAVKRSRAAEARLLVKTIADAEAVYFLSNGTYTQCLNELDVDILSSFTTLTESDGCVTGAEKGSGDGKITVRMSRYLDNGWLYKGATNWTVADYVGRYLYSGNGGYGIRFGFADSQREPLSCLEYACYTVEEGSFCRSVMGLDSPPSVRPCLRFYHE